MKKIKLSFAAVAMLLGITAAFAFKPAESRVSHKFAKDPTTGVWSNIDGLSEDASIPYTPGTYRCSASSNSCTVVSETQPATGSNPSGAQLGTFTMN